MTLSPVQYHCAFSRLLLAMFRSTLYTTLNTFLQGELRPSLLRSMLRNRLWALPQGPCQCSSHRAQAAIEHVIPMLLVVDKDILGCWQWV